jgi:hypothetical protein
MAAAARRARKGVIGGQQLSWLHRQGNVRERDAPRGAGAIPRAGRSLYTRGAPLKCTDHNPASERQQVRTPASGFRLHPPFA